MRSSTAAMKADMLLSGVLSMLPTMARHNVEEEHSLLLFETIPIILMINCKELNNSDFGLLYFFAFADNC